VQIDCAKAEDWIKKGAQPSNTVKRLMEVVAKRPA
jgi:ribosomal protein S16